VNRFAQFAAAAAITLSAGIAAADYPIYASSFESPTYTAGQSVNNVDGWLVDSQTNDVTITAAGATPAAEGSQYLTLSAGAGLSRSISGTDGLDLLWVEGYFRGTGSSVTLDQANYSITDASAIVHFSQANGIEMENGTGDGTKGAAVASGVAINANNWYKITIQLNFTPDDQDNKTWKIWVNDAGVPAGNPATLNFRNNAVTKLNGFKNLAQGESLFDGFRVVKPILGDANGDGIVDASDVIELIDYVTNGAPNIILQVNGDINGADGITLADVEALKMRLLAMN
jgi:hypothetical protein